MEKEIEKKDPTLDEEYSVGMAAVALAEKGENAKTVATDTSKTLTPKSTRCKWLNVNWKEFFHLIFMWLLSAAFILVALSFITIARGTDQFRRDLLMQTDTLSLMFSLVLSAALEQIWYSKKNSFFQITKMVEIFLAFIGLLLYTLRSIVEITVSQINDTVMSTSSELSTALEMNLPIASFFQNSDYMLEVNVLYIFVSCIIIIVGFYLRTLVEIE